MYVKRYEFIWKESFTYKFQCLLANIFVKHDKKKVTVPFREYFIFIPKAGLCDRNTAIRILQ